MGIASSTHTVSLINALCLDSVHADARYLDIARDSKQKQMFQDQGLIQRFIEADRYLELLLDDGPFSTTDHMAISIEIAVSNNQLPGPFSLCVRLRLPR